MRPIRALCPEDSVKRRVEGFFEVVPPPTDWIAEMGVWTNVVHELAHRRCCFGGGFVWFHGPPQIPEGLLGVGPTLDQLRCRLI
jgi:hypothetical protein